MLLPHAQPESGILPLALTGGAYGEGAGPIYLKGLQCRGNENNLFDCQSSNYSNDYTCNHLDDAAVICPREKHTACNTNWVVLSTTIYMYVWWLTLLWLNGNHHRMPCPAADTEFQILAITFWRISMHLKRVKDIC